MAQYTPSSGDYCRPFRSPWGGFPTKSFRTISTHGALAQGTLLTLNTAGSTAVNTVIPSTGAGGLNAFSIVGILADTVAAFVSSATEGIEVSVWEANPNVEFKAITKGGAVASSNIGLRKALAWDSTLSVLYVDLTVSTATDWRVVVTQNIQAVGDSGGYVAFRFLNRTGDQINSTILSSVPVLAFYA